MNGPITHALDAVRLGGQGDARARERLFELVKEELDAMAHGFLAQERAGHGLQTTVLVDDAYMRLVGPGAGAERDAIAGVGAGMGAGEGGGVAFWNRRHFFGAAAEAVRRILIDHARMMAARKRGGRMKGVGGVGIDLEGLPCAETHHTEWEELGEALVRLEGVDARAAEVVRLRFFAGLSEEKAAEVLGVADRTVRRDWVFAKAWLAAECGRQES